MPDTPTTRLGMYKSLPDGSEDVDYVTDIGQNLDKLDAAVGFQAVTSSTRPGSPYSGKPIVQTDTSYSTYFSNGTAPASGSWIEIPNSSAAFGGNLTIASGKQINIGGSTSAAPLAIFTTSTSSNIISSRITGDTTNSRWFVNADGNTNWGAGGGSATDTNLYRSAANTLKTDDNLVVGLDLKLANGATTVRNQLATTTTVANTTTETVIGTMTIPAADAVVGAVYRVVVFGTASVTGTPSYTVRGRLGGVAGTLAAAIGPTTASSGVTNQAFSIEFDLVCLTTGASATWMPRFVEAQNVSVATQTGSVVLPTSGASITQDSTVSNAMVVTWAWGTASASNTVTARAFGYRIA